MLRRRAQMARMRERIEELGRLTHQLLSHAMVSHRAQSMTAERVDLRDVPGFDFAWARRAFRRAGPCRRG